MDACNAKPVTEEEVESMWALFGPPPILRSESKVGYYKLRKAFIRYFRPKDARQWSWVRELVDTQWEIHGHLRKRTLAVERYDPFWREHQYKTIFQHLQQAKKEAHELSPQLSEYECLQEFQGRLTSRIAIAERQLLELAQPNDSKDRLAYETAAKHVEKADKWLKNATQRRNTLLKILEYFCRRADREAEIAAARYDHVQQDEVRKIAVPRVVPSPAAIDNITTQDHTEALHPLPVAAQQSR